MKDWSDLEEKYQDMRLADPKSAQSFKQRMTARFQVCSISFLLIVKLISFQQIQKPNKRKEKKIIQMKIRS